MARRMAAVGRVTVSLRRSTAETLMSGSLDVACGRRSPMTIGHHREPGRAGERRPTLPRAAVRGSAGPARVMTAGALALLALRGVAAVLPGRWPWGLDLAR